MFIVYNGTFSDVTICISKYSEPALCFGGFFVVFLVMLI